MYALLVDKFGCQIIIPAVLAPIAVKQGWKPR